MSSPVSRVFNGIANSHSLPTATTNKTLTRRLLTLVRAIEVFQDFETEEVIWLRHRKAKGTIDWNIWSAAVIRGQ